MVTKYFFSYVLYHGTNVVQTLQFDTNSTDLDSVHWSVEKAMMLELFDKLKPLVKGGIRFDSVMILVFDDFGNAGMFNASVLMLDPEYGYVTLGTLQTILNREAK
jgi:hypothetical protein